MKAVILAGGRGTRLAPYTTTFPKPLVPIGDRPILEIIIRQLAHHGFREAVLSVGYLSELIEAYFSTTGHRLGNIDLRFVREGKPSGTAGSLAHIESLDETFLVMNGDVLSAIDYSALVEYHRNGGAALTIASQHRDVRIDFGVLKTDDGQNIVGYEEKPVIDYCISMGVYVYEPRVLKFIQPDTYLDFPDLVLRLLQAGEKISAFPYDGEWLDIGRHEDYAKAQAEFQEKRHLFLPDEIMEKA